jgi:transcriptional regulator with XRE-family HTH domain
MRQEAIVAKNPSLANMPLLKPFSGMPKRDSYARGVGRRLRVAAAELGFPTQQALADEIGATRGAVDAWYNGRALPPVSYLQRFTRDGIALEWIYYGEWDRLSYQKAINLRERMDGRVPPDVRPEPEALRPSDKLVGSSSPPTGPKNSRRRAAAPRASGKSRKPASAV